MQFLPLHMVLWYIVDSLLLSSALERRSLVLQFTIVNLIHQAKSLPIVPTSEVHLNPSHLPTSLKIFRNFDLPTPATPSPQPFNHKPSYNRPDYPPISLSLSLSQSTLPCRTIKSASAAAPSRPTTLRGSKHEPRRKRGWSEAPQCSCLPRILRR